MATAGYLIQPLLNTLSTAPTLCAEIKQNRHCGLVHTQLDLLEKSLLDGPSFIRTQCAGIESIAVSETAVREFASHTTQLALICVCLQNIAYPSHIKSEHNHEHRSSCHLGSSSDEKDKEQKLHHKRHSNTKPLIFSAFEPIHHHHHHHSKEPEDPHFHDIREEWEIVRSGIAATLGSLKKEDVKEEVKIQEVEIKMEEGREDVVKETIEEKVKIKEEAGKKEVVKGEKVEIEEEAGKIDVVHDVVKQVEVNGVNDESRKIRAT